MNHDIQRTFIRILAAAGGVVLSAMAALTAETPAAMLLLTRTFSDGASVKEDRDGQEKAD